MRGVCIIASVLMLIAMAHARATCAEKGGEYVTRRTGGAQCFVFNVGEIKNWRDASAQCKLAGDNGRLACPSDPSAFLDYKDNKYGDRQFWVGASDAERQGYWVWVTGAPFNGPWSREPGGYEYCLLTWTGNGYDDKNCNLLKNYICELPYLNYT